MDDKYYRLIVICAVVGLPMIVNIAIAIWCFFRAKQPVTRKPTKEEKGRANHKARKRLISSLEPETAEEPTQARKPKNESSAEEVKAENGPEAEDVDQTAVEYAELEGGGGSAEQAEVNGTAAVTAKHTRRKYGSDGSYEVLEDPVDGVSTAAAGTKVPTGSSEKVD